jgi:predicted CXXCH cytochrome family protein
VRRHVVRALAAVAVWCLSAGGGPAAAQDNAVCLGCHQAGGLTVTFPDGGTLDATVHPQRFGASVHAPLPCVTCHAEQADYPHPPIAARTARAYQVGAQQICTTCHADAATAYAAGSHGAALGRGSADVPLCTSCHTAHEVVPPRTASFRNSAPELCGNCHADEALMARYGVRAVYQAYTEEFHGVTTRLYRIVTPMSPSPAAVCSDCHTAHRVLPPGDPASTVSPANVLGTCRACHTSAGRFFATAWTEHRTPSLRFATLVYLVQLFYWILIPATVVTLVALTALDLWYWVRVRRRGGRA